MLEKSSKKAAKKTAKPGKDGKILKQLGA